ncbi:MAG: ROK family transcriptional regulator [Aggregatilineales bacterium]
MMRLSLAGTNSTNVKSQNLSAILLALLQNADVSRVHLAQVLGVSNATITNLVSELTQQGYITEKGFVESNGQVGRRQRALRLVPNARYVLGVHIDVGTVYIALTDVLGVIVDRESFQHHLTESWQSVLDKITATIQIINERNPKRYNQIVGIGVAASGLINVETGVNVFAPNLNWHDVPIQHYLQQRFSFPVIVDNNVRAMALGEALFGDGQHVNAMAFVYGRVGVGAGIVVDGQLYRGAVAGAGEIGHTIFVFNDGHTPLSALTPLENIVSEPAICAEAQKLTGETLDLKTIIERAKSGDATLRTMLEDRAVYLGLALANMVNILNPELIVLGGIFQQAETVMLEKIQDTVRRYAFANLGERVTILTSRFGQEAGMVGSAALALDSFFYRSQTYSQEA